MLEDNKTSSFEIWLQYKLDSYISVYKKTVSNFTFL